MPLSGGHDQHGRHDQRHADGRVHARHRVEPHHLPDDGEQDVGGAHHSHGPGQLQLAGPGEAHLQEEAAQADGEHQQPGQRRGGQRTVADRQPHGQRDRHGRHAEHRHGRREVHVLQLAQRDVRGRRDQRRRAGQNGAEHAAAAAATAEQKRRPHDQHNAGHGAGDGDDIHPGERLLEEQPRRHGHEHGHTEHDDARVGQRHQAHRVELGHHSGRAEDGAQQQSAPPAAREQGRAPPAGHGQRRHQDYGGPERWQCRGVHRSQAFDERVHDGGAEGGEEGQQQAQVGPAAAAASAAGALSAGLGRGQQRRLLRVGVGSRAGEGGAARRLTPGHRRQRARVRVVVTAPLQRRRSDLPDGREHDYTASRIPNWLQIACNLMVMDSGHWQALVLFLDIGRSCSVIKCTRACWHGSCLLRCPAEESKYHFGT